LATLSADGSTVITLSEAADGKRVRIWNATTGRANGLVEFLRNVRTFELSPDGQRVLIFSNEIGVLDFKTGKPVKTLAVPDGWVNAAFGADGRVVVTTHRDGATRVWSVETGRTMAVLAGHADVVNNARLSHDGNYLVTASNDRTARIWVDGSDDVVSFLGTPTSGIAFSPDGLHLATAYEKSVRIWNVATRQQLVELSGHTEYVSAARFSPDNRRLLTGSADRTARVWDIDAGRTISILSGHTDTVNDASFSPDGARVVTASRDGTARIWDSATGRTTHVLSYYPDLGTYPGLKYGVNSAVFSPDGTRVLTGATDGSARIWDVETGKVLTVLAGHTGGVSNALFSPDGRRIVTTSEPQFLDQLLSTHKAENTVRIWDAAIGKTLVFLRGHTDGITRVAFQADGRRLLTASSDGTSRIWDTQTWQTMAVLTGREGKGAYAAAISPNGRMVATAGDKVGLWTIFPTTQELVDAVKTGVGRCLTRAERDSTFLPPEPPLWCVEMEKWPYQSRRWKEWLKAKHTNDNAQLPEVAD
jgi:WD40 repeat protein